ncbi:putative phosphohistidine phosphatase, SixA [Rhodopseudomonas palustris HaA2]|uniref:Putative phosphohistidine phosphatase, SixA n=1 Tax=Rhodopseudomonas palustris (strain HaA2) TaxID=316058 RepID=Q2ITE3_RHOP2|nr:histidine phosphatase family protein [Rhodopseudomonas palustris]ABD08517.1 putative phosphohistidine phosphatase, SixA [Rhodopseudomonas palustris HaA2]
MRRLILLRHAKTETDAPSGKDHDRRLDDRGRTDAATIAEWLAEHRLVPDQVLVSTATRTRQTWDILADLFPAGTEPQVEHLPELYSASPAQLLQAIHDVAAGINQLMLVGHNPGLQELALGLTCGASEGDRKLLSGSMPTSAVAVIDFAIADWADARFGTGKLQHFISPKILREAS